MIQILGCGFNEFQQLSCFQNVISDFLDKEPSEKISKEISSSGYALTKPFLLCETKANNTVVTDVKFTWSRLAVTVKRDQSCITIVSCPNVDSAENEKKDQEFLALSDFICQAATDHDLLLHHETDNSRHNFLKDGENCCQDIQLKHATDQGGYIKMKFVAGSNKTFHCIYDGISFGHFSCTCVKQTSQGQYTFDTDNNQQSNPVSVIVNHIDCVVPIKEVSCGKEHVLLLGISGSVFSFGLSSRGQLGHGNVEDEKNPRLIEALEGLPVISVVAGGWHSLALSAIGDVYVWGWNESGQLGFTTINRHDTSYDSQVEAIGIQPIPKCLDIPGDSNIKSIASGSRHTLVLTDKGRCFACGWNGYGQLALGHTDMVDKLTAVDGLPGSCSQIFAGQWNSVFVCQN